MKRKGDAMISERTIELARCLTILGGMIKLGFYRTWGNRHVKQSVRLRVVVQFDGPVNKIPPII